MKTIMLAEVLREMRKLKDGKIPVPFNISGYTFSAQNRTGGKKYYYENATLMQSPKVKGAKRLASDVKFKNPNHRANRTRNLMTAHGERKINILFITEFNGMDVIY